MDLNKNIGKPMKRQVYPSKKTINFIVPNENVKVSPMTVLLLVLVAVAVLIFAKFAIVDVIQSSFRAQSELNTAQVELTNLKRTNSEGYELDKLAAYGTSGVSDQEREIVYRGDVLALVDKTIQMTETHIQYISAKENSLELRFEDAQLSEITHVVSTLESSPLVEEVTINTAKTNGTNNVITTLSVILKNNTTTAKEKGE